jgi:hypothetical protein
VVFFALAILGCGPRAFPAGQGPPPTLLDASATGPDGAAGSSDGAGLETSPVGLDLTLPDTVSPCPAGESHFKGHCYVAFGVNWMDHATAKATCAAFKSQLASIGSKAENAFVLALLAPFTEAAWIGLTRTGKGSGDFVWADGAKLSFTNWASAEPDGAQDGGGCVTMWGPGSLDKSRSGRWQDQPCTYEKRDTVVCERAAAP